VIQKPTATATTNKAKDPKKTSPAQTPIGYQNWPTPITCT